MLQQGNGGTIVLVTHVLGERGLPNTSVYAAAHGAVHNLIRALAQEIAPAGISINGIALGWMEWMRPSGPSRRGGESRAALSIIKRAGLPEDVGPIAVWARRHGGPVCNGTDIPGRWWLTQHL